MTHAQTKRLAALAALCLAGAQMPAGGQTIERVKLTDNDLNCTQIFNEVQQMETMISLSGAAPANSAAANAAPVPAADNQNAAIASGLASLFGSAQAGGAAAAVPQGLLPNQAGIPNAALADPAVQASIARARAAGYSDAQINAAMQMGAARAGYPVGAALAAQAAPAPAPAPQAAAGLGSLFGALAGGGRTNPAQAAQAASLFGSLAQASQSAPAPAPVASPQPAAPQSAGAGVAAQARARKDHLTGLFLSKGCKLSDVKK